MHIFRKGVWELLREGVLNMILNEVESLTGIDSTVILIYEKKELLAPKQRTSGKTDYTKEDIDTLLRIKVLRGLHIPLKTIKELKENKTTLSDLISKEADKIRGREGDTYLLYFYNNILEDGADFHNLDAGKYLDMIEKAPDRTGIGYLEVRDIRALRVFSPWKRYFSRILDLNIYAFIWKMFLMFAFHVSPLQRNRLEDLLDLFVVGAMMLILEPIWLYFFKGSLGKIIFRIKVENYDGSPLSYKEGFQRTWKLMVYGLGLRIPFLSLYCLWKSYGRCKNEEVQPWERGYSHSIKEGKKSRMVLFVGAYVIMGICNFLLINNLAFPPNMGKLTEKEFVENYNYYVDYLKVETGGQYLQEDGSWVFEEKPENVYVIYLYDSYSKKAPFQFVLEDGYIKEVFFEEEITDESQEGEFKTISSYREQMILTTLALGRTKKDIDIITRKTKGFIDAIPEYGFDNFSFEKYGVQVVNEVDYKGYKDSVFFIKKLSGEETYFRIRFSVRLIE